MEDLLIELLESFGYPVILQGSMNPEDSYPDHFFTFWNSSTYNNSHYDNEEIQYVYEYDVNFYSVNAEMVYSVLREAKKLLKSNGFISSGDGHSVASDEPTHDGRGMTFTYLKQL